MIHFVMIHFVRFLRLINLDVLDFGVFVVFSKLFLLRFKICNEHGCDRLMLHGLGRKKIRLLLIGVEKKISKAMHMHMLQIRL